jgi:G3E family GTPase
MNAERTPVLLLTGFLGSGKTTLLARMIADPCFADTAVLINEFGDVALDHQLAGRLDDSTVVLKSGCLCCTLRGDLAAAVRDLHARRARGDIPHFKRLVIETTGLADPLPILATFYSDPVLRYHLRVTSTVVTLDSLLGTKTLECHAESRKQVAVADCLVMTKTDLTDPATVMFALAAARMINPDAAVFDAHDADPSDLFGSWLHRPALHGFFCEALGPIEDNAHLDRICSTQLEFEEKTNWSVFCLWLTMLLHSHARGILRVKAILDVDGFEGRVAVHGVQTIVHAPVHLPPSRSPQERSRAVFIHHGELGDAIVRSLNAFGIRARRS